MNQCDGCRRKLPIKEGLHYNPDGSYDMICCTKKLYKKETMMDINVETADVTGVTKYYAVNLTVNKKPLEVTVIEMYDADSGHSEYDIQILDEVGGTCLDEDSILDVIKASNILNSAE